MRIFIVSLAALLLTIAGCESRVTQKLPNRVTFQSEEKAPPQFDAWTFFWLAPIYDPDARMEAIILQPDGKEYGRYELRTVSNRIRSDFLKGFPCGDPATLANGIIRFKFQVNRGGMNFYPDYKYGFAFYTKSDSGSLGGIEWDKPFKFIPAVMGDTR